MKIRLIALLCTSLLLTGCGQGDAANLSETNSAVSGEISAGSETSDEEVQEPYVVIFDAPTIDGEQMTSDCFADSKLTMLNVWATYCNPCLNEMPALGEIATEYDITDFQMIGIVSDVSIYSEADMVAEASDLVAQTKADTYPHLLLSQSLYDNLVCAIDSVPTTFFVNQDGQLLGYIIGAQSKETWKEIIDELLAKM